MTTYRARWVVPIVEPPIEHGWIAISDGRISGVGQGTTSVPTGGRAVNLGSVALMPGLTNAHTHLELSRLRGQVAPAPTLPSWVRSLMGKRLGRIGDDLAAIVQAVAEARAFGTAMVGDVANTLLTVGPLCESRMRAVVFRELLGFDPAKAARLLDEADREVEADPACPHVRLMLAPHAPYSTSPALLQGIADWQRRHDAITTVHLAESSAEIEFLETGQGEWRTLLEGLSAWTGTWSVPGTSPVDYLERLGCLNARTLVAHGVYLSDAELARLATIGTTLVTCPRSNVWVGSGDPPIARFYASGCAVAVGTDSLASADDLNVFAELAAMRRIAPAVPARTLLDSATRVGARALGFADAGTLEPGAVDAVIAVETPDAVTDVEEYLVSGIAREQIAWIADRNG